MEKIVNVTEPSLPLYDEYIEEIKSIWDTKWLTHTGPKHQQLEQELREYLQVNNLQLFANGHLALEIALEALNITGEVITTPFTFASTTQAIAHKGLKPVFCDIEPEHCTIDVSKIEGLITEQTSAIMPVHVYGYICDYIEIERIARKHGLKVIYDAAHAFGETIDDVNVGNLGDISMFSFHATKVYNTVEGGGLTFSNAALNKEFKALRQFGMYGIEDAEMLGTNAKMTEFHAAMGLCNMKHINNNIEARKKCVNRYNEHLDGIEGIYIPPIQNNVKSNYAYFPVFFDEKIFRSRDDIFEKLKQNSINARKYFYPLTSDFSIIKTISTNSETPMARKSAAQVLTLPLYSELENDVIDKICSIIKK